MVQMLLEEQAFDMYLLKNASLMQEVYQKGLITSIIKE